MDFTSKNILITGGSRGIGKGLAKTFCRAGAKVAFGYKTNSQSATALEEELSHAEGDVKGYKLDVSKFEETRRIIEEIKVFLDDRIDILINNAGITRDNLLFKMKEEEWKEVLDTNLNGLFNVTRACIFDFLKKKRGCIINMASVSGLVGIPGQTNYSSSKAGIIGFTKTLAKEVMQYGINVNAVAPGYIDTDMVRSMGEDKYNSIIKNIPAGRLGSVDEICAVVKFLASDNAKYITGQVITVDGGLSV